MLQATCSIWWGIASRLRMCDGTPVDSQLLSDPSAALTQRCQSASAHDCERADSSSMSSRSASNVLILREQHVQAQGSEQATSAITHARPQTHFYPTPALRACKQTVWQHRRSTSA